MIPSILLLMLLGYLCGSIPFGLLLGWSRGVDVRKLGSGNVGATNVGRTLGRKWGVLCLVLDALKGMLPVLLAGWQLGLLNASDAPVNMTLAWLGVGVCAVLGHVFPVWLKFKGGKGVATALGVLLGFWPLLTIPALAALVTWIMVTLATRYISVASIAAAACLPVYLLVVGLWWRQMAINQLWPFLLIVACLSLLVIFLHRANISRLMAGREPKWGQKKNVEAVDASPAAKAE